MPRPNPVPQALPLSLTDFTSVLPAGVAVHGFNSIPLSRITTPATTDLLPSASLTSGGWTCSPNDGITILGAGTQKAGAIMISVNTLCKTNIKVRWDVKTVSQFESKNNALALQYRIGSSGNFTNLGTLAQVYASAGTTNGYANFYSLDLPAALENKPEVQLRWIYWETTPAATLGKGDRLGLGHVIIDADNSSKPPVVTAASNTVCSGATTALTASGCNGIVTWSNGAQGDMTMVPAGNYTATCTVNGCVSNASAKIIIKETKVDAPVIIAGPTDCPAGTAVLTATNYKGNVNWSNGASGTVTTVVPGDYTATCTFNGCTSAASESVTVLPCPPPCPASGNLLQNGSFE